MAASILHGAKWPKRAELSGIDSFFDYTYDALRAYSDHLAVDK